MTSFNHNPDASPGHDPPRMDGRAEVDGLIDRLERERGLWEQLHALASRQQQLLDPDNAGPAEALMSLRRRLIEQIAALRNGLEHHRARWERVCQEADPSRRQQVDATVAAIERMRGEIMVFDRQMAQRAGQLRGEALSELQRVDRGGRLTRAYAAPPPKPASAYTDHRG